MRLLKRISLITVITGVLFLIFITGSILVDGWIGGERINQLVNTWIDNPAGKAIGAYVAQPPAAAREEERFPAVIMLHEFWGMRPELQGKAEALAAEGYVVVAADTYRGQVTNWIPKAIYLASTTPTARVNQDLDTVFSWLATQPNVDPARIMVMGFCYGGGKALQYSLHNPALAATGIFYGSLITDPAALRALPGPVLGIFGGADQSIPVEEVQTFQQTLESLDIPNQISIYPGEGHAFVQSIEAIQQGGAQGAAWQEFLTFLADHL